MIAIVDLHLSIAALWVSGMPCCSIRERPISSRPCHGLTVLRLSGITRSMPVAPSVWDPKIGNRPWGHGQCLAPGATLPARPRWRCTGRLSPACSKGLGRSRAAVSLVGCHQGCSTAQLPALYELMQSADHFVLPTPIRRWGQGWEARFLRRFVASRSRGETQAMQASSSYGADYDGTFGLCDDT